MEDPNAWAECEGCKKNFVLRASAYEKLMEDEEPIVCPECFGKIEDAQIEEALGEQQIRCFEYRMIKIYSITEDELNKIGGDGWEMTAVSGHTIFFKKEYFK
jgi:hypothetical protein